MSQQLIDHYLKRLAFLKIFVDWGNYLILVFKNQEEIQRNLALLRILTFFCVRQKLESDFCDLLILHETKSPNNIYTFI
jgi:hypothetical protein